MRRIRISTTCLAVAASLLAAPLSGAAAAPAGQFHLVFTSQKPGTSTGIVLQEAFANPSDPRAKPSPVRQTVLRLPAGSMINGQAITTCDASDAELMLLGPSACPASSRIGSGTAQSVSGMGPPFDPFLVDADLFNRGTATSELFAAHGTAIVVQVGHEKYSSQNTLTEDPPPTPGGPPDFQSAPTQVDFTYQDRRGTDGRPFIETPPSCPPSGEWTTSLMFTNDDGHTYTLTGTTPCQVPPRPRRPACRTRSASGRAGHRRGPCRAGCRRCRSRKVWGSASG